MCYISLCSVKRIMEWKKKEEKEDKIQHDLFLIQFWQNNDCAFNKEGSIFKIESLLFYIYKKLNFLLHLILKNLYSYNSLWNIKFRINREKLLSDQIYKNKTKGRKKKKTKFPSEVNLIKMTKIKKKCITKINATRVEFCLLTIMRRVD